MHSIKPLLFSAILGTLSAAAPAAVRSGDRFPALPEVATAQGTVLLVDFWASWCAPCKASFPTYAALDADYRAKGLTIVAVSVDDKEGAYEAFVQAMHPPFTTVRDKDHLLVSQVEVPVMPSCYLLGRDGRVRYVHTGFHGGTTEKQLRQEIEALLAEKSSS